MSPPSQATIARRHDLDALRAIAMLLGIALHAALSFIPLPEGFWSVQDRTQSGAFGVFMAVLHGFRMPLFFLISGFFTAMLWRKRGLQALLVHRFKRIFLPLMIGMVTIVPAVWIVSIWAGMATSRPADDVSRITIWNAAGEGDVERIKELLASGISINDSDPVHGATPLSHASWNGEVAAMEALINQGADINARNRDGSTALHGAAFFGQPQAARLLIKRGADIDAIDSYGTTVAGSLQADWGRTSIVASVTKVQINRDRVTSGRTQIGNQLSKVDPVSAAEMSPPDATTKPDATADPNAPSNKAGRNREGIDGLILLLTFFPVFHHLWFLYFLCWLVAAFTIYALARDVVKWPLPAWLALTPARYLWLIPLTMLPQSMMGLIFPTFGPDTSVGLLPMPWVLFYYAVFFFFGAIYFDCDDREGRLGRGWWMTVPLALLVVFPLGMEFAVGEFGFGGELLAYEYHRPVAVALQVIYAWLMTFGLMGMFRRLLHRESKTMRYISDSSYWLYLAHLPLIILAQAIVCDWQVPALLKFSLITVLCSLVLLASYQLFVRYTPIGTLLNGPRQRSHPVVDAKMVDPVQVG